MSRPSCLMPCHSTFQIFPQLWHRRFSSHTWRGRFKNRLDAHSKNRNSALYIPHVDGGAKNEILSCASRRCMFGDDHFSDIEFENRFHRSGPCSKLGDMDTETRALLKDVCDNRLGSFGWSLLRSLWRESDFKDSHPMTFSALLLHRSKPKS